MDRRMHYMLATCGLGLGLLLTGTGCRNLRTPEVPPEPPYYSSGAAGAPQVGFSSEPATVNPYGGGVQAGTPPNTGGYGADPAYGTQSALAPAGGGYGVPDSTASYGDSLMNAAAGVPEPEPLQNLGTAGTPAATPPADSAAMPGGF